MVSAVNFDVFEARVMDGKPTSIVYSPRNSRIYVATIDGVIEVYDDPGGKYQLEEPIQVISTILENHGPEKGIILGLTLNPFENEMENEEPVLYVTWNELFSAGGKCVDENSTFNFPGGVSALIYDAKFGEWNEQIIAENLPVSNYDHAINGLVFDLNGGISMTLTVINYMN